MLRILAHPYSLLALTALFWGGNAVAGKLAAGHVSPLLLTLLRWVVVVAIMLPLAARDVRAEWGLIRPRLTYLVLLGALGFTAYNILFYLALNYTTAINVTIEQSGMPLLVFLANFILFRTRVTLFQILGFLLTFVGVAVTAAHGEIASLLRLDLNYGDGLMLTGILFYGYYTVALRYRPPIHWRSMILVLSVSALVTSIPFAAWEWLAGRMILPDGLGMAVVLYTGIFPSIIAQTFYLRGVELIGPNRATLFINLMPVFGAILAVLIVGEDLFLYHLVALAFVLGGLTLAERRVGGRR